MTTLVSSVLLAIFPPKGLGTQHSSALLLECVPRDSQVLPRSIRFICDQLRIR